MGFFSRLLGRNPMPVRPEAAARAQSAQWPFDQPENAAAITTAPVLDGKEEVHVAVHYEDDHAWAFLCGTTDAQEDGRVIAMAEVIKLDPTLTSIADLPPGWKAYRESRTSPWIRAEISDSGEANPVSPTGTPPEA